MCLIRTKNKLSLVLLYLQRQVALERPFFFIREMYVHRYKGKQWKDEKKKRKRESHWYFCPLDNNKRSVFWRFPLAQSDGTFPCVGVGPKNWSIGATESGTGPLKFLLWSMVFGLALVESDGTSQWILWTPLPYNKMGNPRALELQIK